jgi:ribonuclease HIII
MLVIAPIIKKMVDYQISEVLPSQYNELTSRPEINAHHVKTLLHNNAINQLLERNLNKKPIVIMDQFCERKTYEKYCKDLNQKMPQIDIFVTQAESKYISVRLPVF